MDRVGSRDNTLVVKGFAEWILLSQDIVMEDTNRRRRPSLAVLREFAGSRLENQVLMRAYEFAVPAVRVNVGGVQRFGSLDHVIRNEDRSPTIAKGA
jgi:hypothetical protein